MALRRTAHLLRAAAQKAAVVGGGLALALLFFLVLPLIQAIQKEPAADLEFRQFDTAALPPPPPPPEPEQPEEDEKDEPPPELEPEAPPLDLSQLELALDPGVGGGWTTADFAIPLQTGLGDASGGDLFSLDDLDQKPRCIFKQSPIITPAMRRKGGGTVYVAFIVNAEGRVDNPVVQESPDPIYDQPSLDAVRRWRFEPGKRNGQPAPSPMRVPITYKF